MDGVSRTLAYYVALKRAGVPVEMRVYAEGGHAFGLRARARPIAQWLHLVETWSGTIGMLDAADARLQ